VTRPARPASIVLSSALLAGAAIGCSDRRSEWYFVDQREVSDCSPTRLRTGAEVYELDRSDCLH
jgi:hypothetical protein